MAESKPLTEGRFDWEAYQREQNQIYLQQQQQMHQRQQELAPPRAGAYTRPVSAQRERFLWDRVCI